MSINSPQQSHQGSNSQETRGESVARTGRGIRNLITLTLISGLGYVGYGKSTELIEEKIGYDNLELCVEDFSRCQADYEVAIGHQEKLQRLGKINDRLKGVQSDLMSSLASAKSNPWGAIKALEKAEEAFGDEIVFLGELAVSGIKFNPRILNDGAAKINAAISQIEKDPRVIELRSGLAECKDAGRVKNYFCKKKAGGEGMLKGYRGLLLALNNFRAKGLDPMIPALGELSDHEIPNYSDNLFVDYQIEKAKGEKRKPLCLNLVRKDGEVDVEDEDVTLLQNILIESGELEFGKNHGVMDKDTLSSLMGPRLFFLILAHQAAKKEGNKAGMKEVDAWFQEALKERLESYECGRKD